MTNVIPIHTLRSTPTSLRIGDIARLTHKSTRAMRLYEEIGLLGEVVRTEGGQRVYGEEVLVRIAWIDKLQALGFSLTQIRQLLDQWWDHDHAPAAMARIRELFHLKLEETRAQIKALESLSHELEESLQYLQSCEVCDPATLLGACSGCELEHPVHDAPTLVAGFHTCHGQGSGSTR